MLPTFIFSNSHTTPSCASHLPPLCHLLSSPLAPSPSQPLYFFLWLLPLFFPLPFPSGGLVLCSPVANLTVLLANLAAGALCMCMCVPVAILPCQVLLYNTSSCLYTQTHPLPEHIHTYTHLQNDSLYHSFIHAFHC